MWEGFEVVLMAVGRPVGGFGRTVEGAGASVEDVYGVAVERVLVVLAASVSSVVP